MFQPKPLNSAIAVALGALAAVSSNVQADTAFFPHVVVSNTVTTIVSVVNTSDDLYGPQDDDLHYTLMYKNAANNADTCAELNVFLPSSKNDLQTVDLGAPLTENGVLFEPDGGFNVAYTDKDKYNIGTIARNRMTGAPALRGFLLVDNDKSGYRDEEKPSVFGEAIVVEFGVGATWGYSAFSRLDSKWRNNPNEFDDEGDFEDAASKDGYPIQFLPLIGDGSAVSALMITPVVAPKANSEECSTDSLVAAEQCGQWADSDMFDAYGPNSYTATVQLFQDYKQWVPGLYNRDEDPISGSRPQSVTCVGRVEISTLFADVIGESDPLAQGGWGRLANWTKVTGLVEGTATATKRVDDAAVIYKLEYGNEFNGLDIGGTWNNAFWIPNDFEVYIDD